jgi:glycosyltransferase involved in cell wall biosynthesis
MGQANALDTVLRAFAAHAVTTTGTRLVLTGDGPLRSDLVQLAARLGLTSRVEFDPPVRKEEVPSVAARADCLVVNLLDLPVYRYGISLNKIFDYLAASRPVIIATNSHNNPVAEADAGLTVPADDADALGRAMTMMFKASPHDRERWGQQARRYAEATYDYARLGERLNELLIELVEPVRAIDLR